MSDSNRQWIPLKALEHYVCDIPGIDAPPGYRLETVAERDARVLSTTPFEATLTGHITIISWDTKHAYVQFTPKFGGSVHVPLNREQCRHLSAMEFQGVATLTLRVVAE